MSRPVFSWPKLDDWSSLSDVIDALNRRLVGLGRLLPQLWDYIDTVQAEALMALSWLFSWGAVSTATPDVSQAVVQRVVAPVAITALVRPAGESVSFIILVAMVSGVSVVHSATLQLIGGLNATLEIGEARLFAAVDTSGGSAVWQEVGQYTAVGKVLRINTPTAGIEAARINGSVSIAGYINGITALILGTNPASVGAIRLPNNQGVIARNAGNTNDITLIRANVANQVDIDPNGFGVVLTGTLTLPAGLVSVGAADSAGVGFRTLRVPN